MLWALPLSPLQHRAAAPPPHFGLLAAREVGSGEPACSASNGISWSWHGEAERWYERGRHQRIADGSCMLSSNCLSSAASVHCRFLRLARVQTAGVDVDERRH
jgi:hypothetical protein